MAVQCVYDNCMIYMGKFAQTLQLMAHSAFHPILHRNTRSCATDRITMYAKSQPDSSQPTRMRTRA